MNQDNYELRKSWTLRKIEQRASKIESIRELMSDRPLPKREVDC